MDFGIFLAPAADSWKVVKRAEELGYRRAWFYDTQLLNAEVFVAMAAAAVKTSRIRLGTGVLIPSNRIAPVTASGLASLNLLAPGRIDFGISTGFTARRTLGLRPVTLADMEEYIRVVRGLLARETLEWSFEGKRRKIRFLNPDVGAVNVADPIALHVAAMGPRARRVAAKLGAGWIHATSSVAHATAGMTDMQAAWRDARRDAGALFATSAIAGCVLGEGEAADSARARAQAGPTAMVGLHNLVERDEFGDLGRPIPPQLTPLLDRYRQIYQAYEPKDARYLENHRGHLMFLRPEEHEVCTAELIRATTFTGTRAEIRDQLRQIARAGFAHVGITIRHGHPQMLEEWAEVFEGV
jgi:5,10-methylenetetrahydromethanopterin reductase